MTPAGRSQGENGRIKKCEVPDTLRSGETSCQQLTLLTASRSLRPDMVLGSLKEQCQSPEMQGAKAGIAGWTCSTPQETHIAPAVLRSIP